MFFSGSIFLIFGDSRQQDFARDTPSTKQTLELIEPNGLSNQNNNKDDSIEINGSMRNITARRRESKTIKLS